MASSQSVAFERTATGIRISDRIYGESQELSLPGSAGPIQAVDVAS
jgi:hypothetical protein